MRHLAAILIAFAAASPAVGQPAESYRPEIRSFVGAWVPFGAMRYDFRDAATAGVQGAFEVSSRLHLVGSVGWTYGHHRFTQLATDGVYLIHYDLGAELNMVRDLSSVWRAKPFVGLGGGARSYDFGAVGVAASICPSGYAALGGELQRALVALRAEARQYVTCFESPVAGTTRARTDAIYTAGLAFHLR